MPERPSVAHALGFLMAVLLLATGALAQTVLYVNPAAAPGGNGASWGTAYNDLHDALAFATANPDPAGYELRLAQGVYLPYDSSDYFAAPDNITILGGYSAVGDERDPDTFPTIISGDVLGNDDPNDPTTFDDNPYKLLLVLDATPREPVTIDGITFFHAYGRAASHSALECYASAFMIHGCTFGPNYNANGVLADIESADVSDCRFVGNGRNGLWCSSGFPVTVSNSLFDGNGTGMVIRESGGMLVTDCTVQHSAAGGISMTTDSPGTATIRRTTIQQNGPFDYDHGAGIYFNPHSDGATLILDHCDLLDNTIGTPQDPSGQGGAVYASGGAVHANDCLISGNVATFGALSSGGSTGWMLERCTIQNNRGEFMSVAYVGNVTASDCLISHNDGANVLYTNDLSLTRTDITDNTPGTTASGFVIRGGALTLTDCTIANNAQPGVRSGSITADRCTFDSNAGRAIDTGTGNLTDCSITGHTITSGDGAAIHFAAGPSSLTRCVFTDNHATEGNAGALSTGANPATLNGCTFDHNSCTGLGGALAGAADANDCTFTDNTAGTSGGAVSTTGQIVRCTFERNAASSGGALQGGIARDCMFRDNSAEENGGAIRSSIALIGSIVEGNISGNGGGIYADAPLDVVSSIIRQNTAANLGGGIWTSSTTTVTNSIIDGNDAVGGGGVFRGPGGSLTVRNSTIYANATGSHDNGAGIDALGVGGLDVRNSILWGNGASSFTPFPLQIYALSPYLPPYSIVEGATPDPTIHLTGDDPAFLDPVGPDGIPGTADDNLRLDPASPAIDAGDTAALPPDTDDLDDDTNTTEPLPLDLDGNPRVFDSPLAAGSGVDIGPYELGCTGPPDCNGNGVRDDCEIASGDVPDCNGNGIPDSCDIASGFSQDCNDDGIPDECQTLFQYALDDRLETGLPLIAYSPPDPADRSFFIMGQYTVQPGAETIDAVQFFAGSPEETQIVVLVYDDPNNDGDPSDARPIAAAVQTEPQTDPPVKRTVALPPTYVGQAGDSFFVGVYFRIYGHTFAYAVESACNPDREFVSFAMDNLDDARDLSDDTFDSAAGTFPFVFDCANEPGDARPPVSLLIRPEVLAYYDCNADAIPDECQDPTPPDDTNNDQVPDACQCLTDLNGDGRTDVLDFGRIAFAFPTPSGATLIDGDLDADADVDLDDVALFMIGFGDVCREHPASRRAPDAPRPIEVQRLP